MFNFVRKYNMISVLDQEFSQLNVFLKQQHISKIFILTDENTHHHCLPVLLGNMETNLPFEIIEIDPGEEMKTIETALQLWEILAEYEADRSSLLFNLGGGVITDLGGFVASTYKRGIRFINLPTSLLGMCDAAVGGKTGVDLHSLKNMIGTFAMPEKVFLYPDFLKTLPFCELRSGFAEMLKHGLIADAEHWLQLTSLENLTSEGITPFISASTAIKNRIVEQDFHEENIRKTLNFGHTVGHAIESFFLQKETPIAHGEAIAAGMLCEMYLSFEQHLISETVLDSISLKIRKYFPQLSIEENHFGHLLRLMQQDKKNSGSTINFSLINGIGSCIFNQQCSENSILKSLNYYKNLY